MRLCWLPPVESESSHTSVQAHLHAGSMCTLVGCRITDDWQPFPENVGSACSLAVHGCFTVTGLSTEASPGTAHVQNVCLRYCQTWQPGDGYQALLPPAHEEHHRNKAPGSTRRLNFPGLLSFVSLAKRMLVGGKGLHMSPLLYFECLFLVTQNVITLNTSWMLCRHITCAPLNPGIKIPESNVQQKIWGTSK